MNHTDTTPFMAFRRVSKPSFISEDLHRRFFEVMAADMESEPDIAAILDHFHVLTSGTVARMWLKPECRPEAVRYVPMTRPARLAARVRAVDRRIDRAIRSAASEAVQTVQFIVDYMLILGR